MTTSKTRPVVSLCIETDTDFHANLNQLLRLIERSEEDAIIVAPEVALSGFAYERFDEAAAFTDHALQQLQERTGNRLVIFTAISKKGDAFYNTAYALHNGIILHSQDKSKLFALGAEHEHFRPGEEGEIAPFEFDGIKIGILICFELRFKALWQQLEGCDIIAVPAQWGKLRLDHFVTLTNALALMNQCFVIASDAANEETTGMSGIITPFGGEIRNHGNLSTTSRYEERTVLSMRRYLNVGIV
ncbi:carbon-nitrogen hydrolase family protein [Sulfuricurvum sp.]|uniref:carbon-nitrogen hydrolase family protein n=1 Tax=Sulfuricurvum sp. TaxID=2025608 RepID=UPI0026075FB1|nr:carbon-nitrogen hydrolase family protein [Sulfuricurvum sp.]MDD4882860.1 carbon-nitrogen hydrolase family protein [Sulfuricurvum sp.]